MRAELVLDARSAVGESPVWWRPEQALYWVDIPARKLHRWQASERPCRSLDGPEMVALRRAAHQAGRLDLRHGMRPVPDAGQRRRHARRAAAGAGRARPPRHALQRRPLRPPRADAGRHHADGHGAGARRRRCSTGLGANGELETILSDLIVPNGLAFSPDGRTMYLSDSHPSVQRIWAFDYDTATGTPSNRRLFVDMNPLPGRPDGAAVDDDGCYWICGNDAGMIHRFTPAGKLDRSLEVPVKKPAMCAFGGPGLDTLFVTSIRPGDDLSDQPLAGGLFALRPGVRGLPEPALHPTEIFIPTRGRHETQDHPRRTVGDPGVRRFRHRIPLIGRAQQRRLSDRRRRQAHERSAQSRPAAASTRSRSSTKARWARKRKPSTRPRSAHWTSRE